MSRFSVTLLLVILAIQANGQWIQKTKGLYGGRVHSVVTLNGKVLAGTSGGVFVSSDSAKTWSPLRNGIGTQECISLAVVDNTLYAASDYLYKSYDEGKHWLPVKNSAGMNFWVDNLVVAGDTLLATDRGTNIFTINDGEVVQTVPGIQYEVFAASGDRFVIGTFYQGNFVSGDNGQHWVPLPLTDRIFSLSESNGNLLAITPNGKYFSPDQGSTWTPTNLYLSDPRILHIGNRLIASSYSGSVESFDNGATWTFNFDLPYSLKAITSDSFRFYAAGQNGVHRTSDGGTTWELSTTGMVNANVSMIRWLNGSLFAASSNRLFKSTNNGDSWRELKYEPYPNNPNDFECIGAIGSTLYAGTYGQTYVSDDNGETWYGKFGAPPGIRRFASTTAKHYILSYDGLYVSGDNGASWQKISANPYVNGMNGIGDNLYISGNAGNFRIADDGTITPLSTFTNLQGDTDYFTSFVRYGNKVICSTGNSGFAFSINEGKEWRQLTYEGGASRLLEKDNVLYAVSTNGITTSTDGGLTWQTDNYGSKIPEGDLWYNARINDIEFAGDSIFAATAWGGVYAAFRPYVITGIESKPTSLKLYPNPTTGIVTVDLSDFQSSSPKHIELLDARGASLQSLTTDRETASVDLSNYPSGIYLVRIKDANTVRTSKIFKK